MSEGAVHKNLKNVALRWIKEKVTDIVCPEVDFNNIKCVADVVGINFKRKEIRIVEVKATKSDFIRDKKLFYDKTTYYYHCRYCYIMCPKEIILPNELPYGYGLLWVDENDNVEMVKKPIKYTGRLKTMFDTTLKVATKKLTNLFLFTDENKNNKDETGGLFDKRSKIKMISLKCSSCKKQIKELIHKDKTETIICNCNNIIDLKNSKIKEITGFNKSFIEKINKLI